MAVAELKHEFLTILTKHTDLLAGSIPVNQSDSTSTGFGLQEDYNMAYDGLSKEAISDLRQKAERMDSAGNLDDCIAVYASVRKPFVDKRYKDRDCEIEHPRREDYFVGRVEDEARCVDTSSTSLCWTLFAREKQFYEQIFGGIGNTPKYEQCFVETIEDAAIQLFEFAEAVCATSPRSYDKLFQILDLYNALSILLPNVNVLFYYVETSRRSIGINIGVMLSRLEELVRKVVSNFERALVREVSKGGGAIHDSTTKYVMNYVRYILDHKRILDQILVSNPSTSFGEVTIPDKEFVQREGATLLARHLILIIAALRFNLDVKSKRYEKDQPPLVHLFVMNNVEYIVRHIKGTPGLRDMVGEDYLRKLTEDVRRAMDGFLGSTCDRILDCLKDSSKGVSSGEVSKSVVRGRIKKFNEALHQTLGSQADWQVPDHQLQVKLRLSMAEKLIPPYKSFIDQFGGRIESKRHTYIKYSVEDLHSLISNISFGASNGTFT